MSYLEIGTMARRSSLAVVCFFAFSVSAGVVQGCAIATGIPVSLRLSELWKNDVKPLWKYGWNAKPEPEDRLEWTLDPLRSK